MIFYIARLNIQIFTYLYTKTKHWGSDHNDILYTKTYYSDIYIPTYIQKLNIGDQTIMIFYIARLNIQIFTYLYTTTKHWGLDYNETNYSLLLHASDAKVIYTVATLPAETVVSYSVGQKGDIPYNLSSSRRFQTKFISTCNNISATSLQGPQKPTSEGINLKSSTLTLFSP